MERVEGYVSEGLDVYADGERAGWTIWRMKGMVGGESVALVVEMGPVELGQLAMEMMEYLEEVVGEGVTGGDGESG